MTYSVVIRDAISTLSRKIRKISHLCLKHAVCWRRNPVQRVWLLSLLFCCALLSGWWGHLQLDKAVLPSFYLALQLFVLNGSIENFNAGGPILRLSFFIAPAFSFLAVLSLYSREAWRLATYLRRPRTDHIVLCGLGDVGHAFFMAWAASRATCPDTPKLLVIDKNPDPLRMEDCQIHGVCVLHADIMDASVMTRANVCTAQRVVLLLSTDEENMEATRRICDHLATTSTTPVRQEPETRPESPHTVELWPHVRSSLLIERLERFMELQKPPHADLRFFNLYDLTARAFLLRFPPDIYAAARNRERVHLVFFGFGSMGQELAVEAIKHCHYRNGSRLHLTVYDAAAARAKADFLAAYPDSHELCDITFYEQTFTHDHFPRSGITLPDTATQYIVTLGADTRSATFALSLREATLHIPGGNVPIFVRIRNGKGLGNLLDAPQRTLPDCIHPFGLHRDVLNIHGQTARRDLRARMLHELSYIRDLLNESNPATSDRKPENWHNLAYFKRESNRQVVDHISVKLRAIRHAECIATAQPGWKMDLPAFHAPHSQTTQQVLILAKMEKNRWNAERLMSGWRRGPRTDLAKVHDNILSWEEMEQNPKLRAKLDYDKDMSRDIPDIISGGVIDKVTSAVHALVGDNIRVIRRDHYGRRVVRPQIVIGVFAPDLCSAVNTEQILHTLRKKHKNQALLLLSALSSPVECNLVNACLDDQDLCASLWALQPVHYKLHPLFGRTGETTQIWQTLLGRAEHVLELPFQNCTLADMAVGHTKNSPNQIYRRQFYYLASYLIQHCDELILGQAEGEHALVPTELINQWWMAPGSIPDEFAWNSTLHMAPPRNTEQHLRLHAIIPN